VTLDRFRAVILGNVFPVTFAGLGAFLLVVFVVLLPVDDALEAELPYAESAEMLHSALRGLSVRVNGDGTATLRWRRVPIDGLPEAFRALAKYEPGPKWVIVSAGERVSYGSVKAVIARLMEAGAARISFRTRKFRPAGARPARADPLLPTSKEKGPVSRALEFLRGAD
jgi:biopolymer transport protein ExbD